MMPLTLVEANCKWLGLDSTMLVWISIRLLSTLAMESYQEIHEEWGESNICVPLQRIFCQSFSFTLAGRH